jgi:hypothetical protein
MSFASLLILMGLGRFKPLPLALGILLAVITFGAAVRLATRRWEGGRPPPMVTWSLAGATAFYAVAALAAGLAGPQYAVAALLASVIPTTALSLLLATAGSKTVDSPEASSEEADDPYPGIAVDRRTPLGDTPEHSDEAA